MRIYAVRVFSYLWEESLIFYRDTLALEPVFMDANLGWAQFRVGGAQIGLERCDPEDTESRSLVGRFVGVSLEVDNIQTLYKSLLKKGVRFTEPPTVQPWGGVLAHFEDPDGNILTLLGSSENNA